MMLIVMIWGVHFIVVKDAIAILDPITFNAIRFAIGAPFLVVVALRTQTMFKITRRDLGILLLHSIYGPIGYQVIFVTSLDKTTATNTALLVSTMPTWTALLSIFIGTIVLRWMLSIGLMVTMFGVALVILGQDGATLSLNNESMVGSVMLLFGAITQAIFAINVKRFIDRYGGIAIAIWTHWMTFVGLAIIALPSLIALSPDDIPTRLVPNIVYSALLAGVGGYLTFNNALRVLGPARAAAYNNFTPIVAAIVAIAFLKEPLTTSLLIGGLLTLMGVAMVRIYSQVKTPQKSVKRRSALVPTPVQYASGQD